MGQFEKIMDAVEPLLGKYSHAQVDFNDKTRHVGIILKLAESDYSIWDVLFYQDSKGKIAVYFFFDRNPDFMQNHNDIDSSGFQIFSGPNVFHYLGIQYPTNVGGFIQDLNKIVMLICQNFSKFAEAAADENIEKTYFSLKSMSGNNEKEIREVIHPIYIRMR